MTGKNKSRLQTTITAMFPVSFWLETRLLKKISMDESPTIRNKHKISLISEQEVATLFT